MMLIVLAGCFSASCAYRVHTGFRPVPNLYTSSRSARQYPAGIRMQEAFSTLGPPSEFMTSTAGYKLAVRRWPSEQAKATVVLQHGGGWHTGYYDGLGRALSSAGYEVVALDAMGHGYSEGPLRDDTLNAAVAAENGVTQTGVTYWTGLADVQKDLSKLCAQERESKKSPVVVVAESMGAIVAGPLVINKDPNLDALITTGGLMRMTKETQPPGIVCLIFEILGRFFPKRNVIVNNLDGTFDSAFGDPRWAAAARADPLISTNSFYLGPASQNFKAMKFLRKNAGEVSVPLYVMHSKTDTRTDVDAARDFFEDASSSDKEITLYEDASHLLFLDDEAKTQRAIDDMITWLNSRYA